jgi:sulfatase-modifying factor enzyme 1
MRCISWVRNFQVRRAPRADHGRARLGVVLVCLWVTACGPRDTLPASPRLETFATPTPPEVVERPPPPPSLHFAPPGMVPLPAGELWHGTVVYVDAVFVDQARVTRNDYAYCVAARACAAAPPDCAGDETTMTCVTWEDADRYCRWKQQRLPTDAEWEKAITDRAVEPAGEEWVLDGDAVSGARRNPLGRGDGAQHVVREGIALPNDAAGESAVAPTGDRSPRRGFRCAAPVSCAGSQGCNEDGRCSEKDGLCVAASDDDCKASSACRRQRACRAENGSCTGGAEPDCPGSCEQEGLCWVRDEACVAVEAGDCRWASVCALDGRCTLKNGGCVVADAAACAASFRCREEGRCQLAGETCVAQSDADCERAPACMRDGRCTEVEGQCLLADDDDCRRLPDCAEQGRCSMGHGACEIGSEDDCRVRSSLCKRFGLCSFRDGDCVAANEADCLAAELCNEEGACHRVGAACEPKSEADCKKSVACQREGRCKLVRPVAGDTTPRCLAVKAP